MGDSPLEVAPVAGFGDGIFQAADVADRTPPRAGALPWNAVLHPAGFAALVGVL
ncbi:MAG: hypothetical protein ACO3TI_06510 [Aquiluna sp.]